MNRSRIVVLDRRCMVKFFCFVILNCLFDIAKIDDLLRWFELKCSKIYFVFHSSGFWVLFSFLHQFYLFVSIYQIIYLCI